MTPDSFADSLAAYRDRIVVLDLASPYVAIGTFIDEDHRYLILDDADMHDLRDSSSTRELYVLEACRHGPAPNRRRILISRSDVVGISLLEDVVQ